MKTTLQHTALSLAACATFFLSNALVQAGHYEVKKDFKLQTVAKEGLSVRSITYCQAFAFDKPERAAPCECHEVQPADQPAGFNPYRKSLLAGYNSTVVKNVTTNANGRLIVANTNCTEFGAAGDQVSFEAVADDCTSYTKSSATVKVDSFIGTNLITGTVAVTGTNYVVKYNELHKAYAFSMAMMEVQGTNVIKGKVTPGPILRKTAKGPGGPGGCQHQNDPVTFRVRNRVTRAMTTGTLFRFDMETLPGAFGDVWWESNRVHVGVRDLSFRLDLPGPYTADTGHLQLEVRDGVVAQAEASGLFFGVLPPVGTVAPFEFPLDNGLEIAYDLTPVAGPDAEVALELSTAGEVYEEFSGSGDDPALSVTALPGRVVVSWPVTPAPWQLQSTRLLAPQARWSNVPVPPVFNEDRQSVTLPAFGPAQYFRLEGVETPCALSITAQPVDAYAMPGLAMTWFVGTAGTPEPTRFQWQRLGQEGQFLDIPGATEPSMTWQVTPLDQGAQFRCRVDNDCHTTTSLPAKLILLGAEN